MNQFAPMRRLASLLGCTEGQAYTLVIAIIVTIVAIWLGVPPTLRERTPAVPTTTPAEFAPAPAP